MKVITQLVQHFWSRQALSEAQAEYLVSQGFVRAGDLPGFTYSVPADKQPSSFKFKKPLAPPHPKEHVQEELEGRGPTKKARSGKSKGQPLTEKELVKQVESVYADRAELLERFRRWATALGPAADWVAAAVRMRKAAQSQALAALVQAARKRIVSLSDLWSATDIEPLHALVDSPDLRGPVTRAFRLLLTTDGALPPPYAALLKHDALAAAKNLATAHRRLIGTIGQLHDQHPNVLADALGHGNHPVVFWGLTLLYNARRKPLTAPIRPKREYGPISLPSADVWRQAWTIALALDEPNVAGLLMACFKDHPEPTKRDPRLCQFPFHCPLDWRAPN
jgi:hypothetical protein